MKMRRIVPGLVTAAAAIAMAACSGTAVRPPVAAPESAGRPTFVAGTPMIDRPWSSDPRKFTFAIVGDRAGGGGSWVPFDGAMREINLLQPDFAIMVGDLIQGDTWGPLRLDEQWAEFHEHADVLTVPFLVLPGNHDVGGTPRHEAWWREHWGRTYYSFVHENCLFVVLNTEEMKNRGPYGFGEEQVRWAVSEIAAHPDARHTFVLMHNPAWANSAFSSEWPRIEAALGNRPYTVFAGHRHTLSYEPRNGHRYIVLGPTGAGLTESPVRETGRFHHWTQVVVDGDSAHIAIIEPDGRMWPQDIATPAFANAARGIIVGEPLPAANVSGDGIEAGLATRFRNALPDTVAIVQRVGRLDGGWRVVGAPDQERIVLAPGGETRSTVLFAGPKLALPKVPAMRYAVVFRGDTLSSGLREVPMVADAALRHPPAWEIIGPASIRDPRWHEIPEDHRLSTTTIFPVMAMSLREGDGLAWKPAMAAPTGSVSFAEEPVPQYVVGNARCAVWSPTDRVAVTEFRASIYGQVVVNGEMVDGGRLYRNEWIAVPLKAGWNEVLVKVLNITGGWTFSLRFADPAADLRFAVRPE